MRENLPKHDVQQIGYSDLFLNEKLSDFKIICIDDDEDIEFFVHRLILSYKSEIFKAMFQMHSRDLEFNSIKYNDIDAGTMKELLRFIYRDEVNENTDFLKLLYVADKYNLQDLIKICSWSLMKSANVENFEKIYHAAIMHNLKDLEDFCIGYTV